MRSRFGFKNQFQWIIGLTTELSFYISADVCRDRGGTDTTEAQKCLAVLVSVEFGKVTFLGIFQILLNLPQTINASISSIL